MLSNQILKKLIADIRRIVGVDCSVWSKDGLCIVSTCEVTESIGKYVDKFRGSGLSEKIGKRHDAFWIHDEDELMYILVFHEGVEDAKVIGGLCVSEFEHMIQAYKVHSDKNQFYQNLLLDNLLLVDIFNQARKMSIDIDVRRAVFVIEPGNESDNLALETLKGLYATGSHDYVTSVDENHIVYIMCLDNADEYPKLQETALTIVDMLNTEAMVDVRVGYGTIVDNIRYVSKSYKEAMTALDVGRIFYGTGRVFAYNELGIGRLIHQLPVTLCEMFLKEVFTPKARAQLDKETINTVLTFFDNDMNVSETARKLYIHRNTLVYRLDKVERITGLDVKRFDDALLFKIAMMVEQHLKAVSER